MLGDSRPVMKEARPRKSFYVSRIGFLLWALPCFCLAQVSQPTQTEASKKFERLAQWLKSPDVSVRLDAIHELTSVHDSAAIPLILPCLQDTHITVRSAAAWGLL